MAAQAPLLPAPFRPRLEPGAGLVRVCVLASGRARPNAGEALVRITCARHDDPERTGRAGVELCPVIRSDAAEAYFVLGGLCVFEAQVDWFSREIDKLAAPYNAAAPEDIEFHASEVFSRRAAPWDKLSSAEARGTLKSVLQVVNNSYNTTCLLLARSTREHTQASIRSRWHSKICARDSISFSAA